MESTETGGTELDIRHDEQGGAFVIDGDGRRLAYLTYRRRSPGTVAIEHTVVDDALSGRGVGKRLVHAAVDWARGSGTKIVPICPYARAVFDRDAGLRDVLE